MDLEKWNDIAVSVRFKHRGMSWTESGVLARTLHAADSLKKRTLKPPMLTRNTTIVREQEAFFRKNFQKNCIPLDNAVKSGSSN